MAYIYEAWSPDGRKGQFRYDNFRSDSPKNENKLSIIESWKNDPKIVLITRNRTEDLYNELVIWTRPGYVDPVK
jgi:hypothetical protein